MISHNNFYRSLAKKGGTITLPSNDQPSIGAFSIGEVGSASIEFWERASGVGEKGGWQSHATKVYLVLYLGDHGLRAQYICTVLFLPPHLV